MAKAEREMIEVQNVVSPDHRQRVDAAKYHAMREVWLSALPDAPPGVTPAAILEEIRPRLPQDRFPGGEKAGWWAKCVQLDLEAKGIVRRTEKPVRLWKA